MRLGIKDCKSEESRKDKDDYDDNDDDDNHYDHDHDDARGKCWMGNKFYLPTCVGQFLN